MSDVSLMGKVALVHRAMALRFVPELFLERGRREEIDDVLLGAIVEVRVDSRVVENREPDVAQRFAQLAREAPLGFLAALLGTGRGRRPGSGCPRRTSLVGAFREVVVLRLFDLVVASELAAGRPLTPRSLSLMPRMIPRRRSGETPRAEDRLGTPPRGARFRLLRRTRDGRQDHRGIGDLPDAGAHRARASGVLRSPSSRGSWAAWSASRARSSSRSSRRATLAPAAKYVYAGECVRAARGLHDRMARGGDLLRARSPRSASSAASIWPGSLVASDSVTRLLGALFVLLLVGVNLAGVAFRALDAERGDGGQGRGPRGPWWSPRRSPGAG